MTFKAYAGAKLLAERKPKARSMPCAVATASRQAPKEQWFKPQAISWSILIGRSRMRLPVAW
jgi:hypothetical protein